MYELVLNFIGKQSFIKQQQYEWHNFHALRFPCHSMKTPSYIAAWWSVINSLRYMDVSCYCRAKQIYKVRYFEL